MKAAGLHRYREPFRLEDVDEPCLSEPHDIIVRVAAAGLCRTDIHIIDGMLEPFGVRLPTRRAMRPRAGSRRPGRKSARCAPVMRCW